MIFLKKRNPHKDSPPCFTLIGDDQCTGCAACSNNCPQFAIKMRLNFEGFYRPFLQKEACNECVVCLRSCPVCADEKGVAPQDHMPEVYAAWSTDEKIHLSSSSGGIFSELAHQVLNDSGLVCGCEWGDNWTPRHVMIRDRSGLNALRGSKYIPSYISDDFYREIIKLTKAGTKVLFCGTPCQVAGLKLIAPAEAGSNLILVDLVCHGVPSLKSFWCYLNWKFGGRDALDYFSFRNKEISIQTVCAITKAGNKYLKTCGEDVWFRAAMVYHLFLQKSCFACRFGNIPRQGDITLGDYWGIPEQWHNPKGDSVVFANTNKGKELLHRLLQDRHIIVKESEYDTASARIGRLRGVVYPIPLLRNLSLQFIETDNFERAYRFCYLPIKISERITQGIKRRIPKK
jgi:coenzyme F420-reducing hydrogenase beta subunit